MIRRLGHMLVKEMIQLLRDPKARFALFAPTFIQIVIFGYAANFEIRHVRTAVLDYDHSYESRELLSRFAASEYFDVVYHPTSSREIKNLIDRSDVTLAIQLNAGFAELLRKGQSAPVQVILDGTDSNTALIALGYVNAIAQKFGADYEIDRFGRISPDLIATMPTVVLEQRPWYNPDLDSHWFFIPGLIGNIILITVVQLTAFAIVREREMGTLEQIMVTPITRMEFVLGKTVPFFFVGLANTALVATIGSLWFQVPFRGSIAVLLLGTALFLLSTLGFGLAISNSARTQQQSMVSAFFFVMPAVTFSGFGTPISSMPKFLQYATLLNPLSHYLIVVRGVYLKGVGLDVLWPQMLAMAVIGMVLLLVTAARFQKSLD